MVVALNLGENVKHKGQNKVQPYYIKVLSVEYSFADVILMIHDSGLVHQQVNIVALRVHLTHSSTCGTMGKRST